MRNPYSPSILHISQISPQPIADAPSLYFFYRRWPLAHLGMLARSPQSASALRIARMSSSMVDLAQQIFDTIENWALELQARSSPG
jgi:hypothetical protein